MNTNKVEEVYNKTFPGLTLFYRDTEFNFNLQNPYKVGQIIMEKGFTDMTYKAGGVISNLRYLIASSFGKDLSAISVGNFGLTVLLPGSYFKVLDIYVIDDKTQIFLLNIPSDGIEIFKTSTSNIEEDLVIKARGSFDKYYGADPIPELQSKEWLDRISFPLGMTNDGELFLKD